MPAMLSRTERNLHYLNRNAVLVPKLGWGQDDLSQPPAFAQRWPVEGVYPYASPTATLPPAAG